MMAEFNLAASVSSTCCEIVTRLHFAALYANVRQRLREDSFTMLIKIFLMQRLSKHFYLWTAKKQPVFTESPHVKI